MKKLLFVLFFILSCQPLNKEVFDVTPGVYEIYLYNQYTSCTDGYYSESMDQKVYFELIDNNWNNWQLNIGDNNFINCQVINNHMLRCELLTMATIPGICVYPMSIIFNLFENNVYDIVGTIETTADLVMCSNGNSGSCTSYSDLNGIYFSEGPLL